MTRGPTGKSRNDITPVIGLRLATSGAPHAARGFAEGVASRLDGAVLRYSDRVQLLKRAAHLGITRFDANLIIAAVQYRAGPAIRHKPRVKAPTLVSPVAVFALLQCAIAAGAWLMLLR
ncbi:MAG: hypothetical protein ACREJC_11340 [Tepidisphaeraceae bacterium]